MVAPPATHSDASFALKGSRDRSRPVSPRLRMYAPDAGAPSTSSLNNVVRVPVSSRVFIRALYTFHAARGGTALVARGGAHDTSRAGIALSAVKESWGPGTPVLRTSRGPI